LTLHEISEIFEFLGFGLFGGLVARFPLFDFLHKFSVFEFFGLKFLLQGDVHLGKSLFEHLIFMIKCLTNLVEFFHFFTILLPFPFHGETFLSEFSDLDFVIGRVEELSFALFKFDSKDFNLTGEAFDFDGLEDDDELNVFAEVGFFIIG
jgi:hypothetical protein